MTSLDKIIADYPLLRTFCYGREKTKKTWWMGTAAEAGFNLTVTDIDDGIKVLKQISPEARKRIRVINAVDTFDRQVGALFMAKVMKGYPFVWDNTRRTSLDDYSSRKAEHDYVAVDITKANANDVFGLDSYTEWAKSVTMQYYRENEIELFDFKEEGDKWGPFRYAKKFLDVGLNRLHAVQCHLVIIGHETVYEKYKEVRVGNKMRRDLVSQDTIPISSSGPHGMTIGRNFDDILYFRKVAADIVQIEISSEVNRMGGSRTLTPGNRNWIDFPFWKYCEEAGVQRPSNAEPSKAFRSFTGKELPPFSELGIRSTFASANAPVEASGGNATIADLFSSGKK